jgi:hypothetical protein
LADSWDVLRALPRVLPSITTFFDSQEATGRNVPVPGNARPWRTLAALSGAAEVPPAQEQRAKTTCMADVISDYQKWKQQGENLKAQAKQAMESRFRELLSEAVSLAEEYRVDFGVPLKPPPPVTAFRYKPSGRAKAKKAGKQAPVKATPPAEPNIQKSDPKIARLERKLANARQKLEDTKAAGKPTRPIEDRIYEIEDELRLAGRPA